jgi:hypothetical protein
MMDETKHEFESAVELARAEFRDHGMIEVPFALLRRKTAEGYERTRVDARGLAIQEDGLKSIAIPKHAFVQLVREMARDSRADLVMMVMEAWIATTEATTMEEATAERNKYKNVEDMPGRKEVVVIYVEDMESCEIWRANILRGDGGTARLTDFVGDFEVGGGGMTRLLAHLQPQELN